jgi:endonuclease/exonuclease/phosphatase family metal-dependent hydrolase
MKPLFQIIALLLLLGPQGIRAGETLRLLSYNIHHGEGTDGKIDPVRLSDFIKAQQPDILFLQEVDKNCTRSGKVDQAAELAKLTGMTAHFAKFMDFQGGEYGMAILTKLPVLESRTVPLPAGSEPRASAVMTVQTQGGPLSIASVHFYETEAQRLAQAKALSAALGDGKKDAILMGDFNSEPGGSVMKWLGERFHLPEKQGALQFTWPSDQPRENIDHVLFRLPDAWKVKDYRVLDEKVISDHRPLLCVLERE